MRRVFFEDEYEDQLQTRGYVILPLLNDEEINYLIAEHAKIEPVRTEAFYTSIWHNDVDYRRQVNRLISNIIPQKLQNILIDYQPVFANFMVKKPIQKSTLDFHQDWTFVDESKFRAVNVWVPLVDTNSLNGSLHVIEGSHKFKIPYRGRNIEGPYWHLSSKLRKFFSTSLDVPKGQAVIFDERLIHGSFENQSTTHRIAVSNVMAPQESELYHFFKISSGNTICKMKVGQDFFTDYALYDDIMDYSSYECFDYKIKKYSISRFLIDFVSSKIQKNG